MTENELSKVILDASIEVHRTRGGPGLLESVYEESLAFELASRGLDVLRQIEVPINYKGNSLATPLKLDLLVNNLVIIEVNAVTVYNKIFEAQVLTYLRLMNLKRSDQFWGYTSRQRNASRRKRTEGYRSRLPENLCGFATLR